LFNIYFDDVTDLRSTSDYDCNVGRAFYGCIMYAYDLLILSPSVGRLQHLLSCDYEFGNEQHILIPISLLPENMVVSKRTFHVCWIPEDTCRKGVQYFGLNFVAKKNLEANIIPISM
jgi:hypothetical protein